jgi:hypothetical protein
MPISSDGPPSRPRTPYYNIQVVALPDELMADEPPFYSRDRVLF